ncbi:MAG TPA: aldo/keto reductase [Solirubrobacteraceae bacterium]
MRNGVEVPQLGFGVFQIAPDETVATVTHALGTGHRHIDTAAAYHNEAGVGAAIEAAGLERSDVFITTKCWNRDHGYEGARQALARSLDRLGTSYVDLYLIHWPVPSRDLYVETWEALIALQRDGLARAIGVSNFEPAHLERIIAETGVTPAVNQIELHPRLQQRRLWSLHRALGIATASWSPLARGRVLDEPVLKAIAHARGRSVAQVVIRWHLQLGAIVIPRSASPERIAENRDVFDFRLSEAEMAGIGGLDADERIGPHPEMFDRH